MPEPQPRPESDPGQLPRLVIVMLGPPGSGKTSFASQLAEKIGARHLDGDAIARELSLAELSAGGLPDQTPGYRNRYRELWRAAMASGQSIIRGNQHNDLAKRRQLAGSVARGGCRLVIVWLKAPREVALDRVMERRPEESGAHAASRQQAADNYDHVLASFDPPAEDEFWVEIDGQADFDSQYRAFESFWRQL